MVKSIIKEIFIMLLLIISIVLIITVLFYSYRPSIKTVPSKVGQYDLPAKVQEELDTKIMETQNIVKTYKVDSDDLYQYQKSNDYDKGKDNPFDAIETGKTSNKDINSQGGIFSTSK